MVALTLHALGYIHAAPHIICGLLHSWSFVHYMPNITFMDRIHYMLGITFMGRVTLYAALNIHGVRYITC